MNDNNNDLPRRKHLTRIPVWLPEDKPVVYFVTICTFKHRKLFEDRENVRVAVESLEEICKRLGWKVRSICFMPDHVHFLASPCFERDQSLSLFIQRWKSSVTVKLRNCGMTDEIWQREFFDRLLRSDEDQAEKWEYVRANPVLARLCSDLDKYPYIGSPKEILERLRV